MSGESLELERLRERVVGFIADQTAEQSFDALAIDLFAAQFEHNPAYRSWCESLGVHPGEVATPDQIPVIPSAAFKELDLVCGNAFAEFRTSGTSGFGKGRHLVPSLEPYRTGSLKHFARCLLPEGWNMRILTVAPPPEIRPYSSLSRMLAWILEEYGEEGSSWFVDENGLETARLTEALLDAQRTGTPLLITGTSAALLAFFTDLRKQRLAIRLPGGSRLMDTGGQKGAGSGIVLPLARFQEALYRDAENLLGIPCERCVNEYGMTELSSQFYDDTLCAGRTDESGSRRVKVGPHWVRTRILDPVSMKPVADGDTGLLQHLDLANAGSVISILTEDFGRRAGDGFILEGRSRAAEARGCGMTFDEMERQG